MIGLSPECPQGSEEIARRGLHAARDSGSALEEVGTANIANKNKISGQRADCVVAALEIGNEEGEMLRRMSRGMQRVDAYAPDGDLRAVLQPACIGKRSIL